MSTRNEWWDEECRQIITQNNEARRKYLQIKTRASREAYEARRTEANRVCRRKKQEWINNKIKHIKELNDKKETRKFFKKRSSLINNNQPCQTFAKIRSVIYCQNTKTYYKDGSNTFVICRV
jgi:hypothetical protein